MGMLGTGITVYAAEGTETSEQTEETTSGEDWTIDVEGIKNICLSLPTIINKNGIEKVIYPRLSDEEHALLRASAQKLKDYVQMP